METGGAQRGTKVSQGDVAQLQALQAVFKPETGLKRLDDFAKWIFVASAAVGTLAGGFGKEVVDNLDTAGEISFGLAVVSVTLALGFAAWSAAPKWVIANTNSAESMATGVATAYRRRRFPLTAASVFLTLAILLAGASPLLSALQTNAEAEPPTSDIIYSVSAEGAVEAVLEVNDLEPFVPVVARIVTEPPSAKATVPRARGRTDEDGHATLTVAVPKPAAGKRLSAVGSWADSSDGVPVEHTRLRIRRR